MQPLAMQDSAAAAGSILQSAAAIACLTQQHTHNGCLTVVNKAVKITRVTAHLTHLLLPHAAGNWHAVQKNCPANTLMQPAARHLFCGAACNK
jgi:hypothetical protein